MSFQVTSAAAREIRAAADRSGAAGMALRVAARTTHEGLAYALGFDEPADSDAVTVVEGLTVLVGADSQGLLAGTVLDYVQLDTGTHDFIFVAPAAAGGCGTQARGCGSGRCGSCG
ncbi:MAG: iron-sulfur cluster assembly accessory protein [Comamonadaceae bacterium]|nr:MAG: iron-sulfur cluster assembly accessory protein [Comamonadaceae bacterium]